MTDDELEVWRRAWHSQPAVPIDLIRKVERQTIAMRRDWILQIAPGLIGVGIAIAAVIMQTVTWILLAVGTWFFIFIGWRFMLENQRGVWAPASETTAAYVELSIERCRRALHNIRFGNVMLWLLTAFVLIADYQILKSEGGLSTTSDFLITIGVFALTTIAVSMIFIFQLRKRRQTQADLEYLLDLQRQARG
jgi:hypothetical protein